MINEDRFKAIWKLLCKMYKDERFYFMFNGASIKTMMEYCTEAVLEEGYEKYIWFLTEREIRHTLNMACQRGWAVKIPQEGKPSKYIFKGA